MISRHKALLLVGHLTCMLPCFKGGLPRPLHGAAGVGSRGTQRVAPLVAANSTCGSLSAPLERGWIPIPGFSDSLKPSDDLFWFGRVLSVQGPSFEKALYGLGHV